jgi:hypothetical protein
MSTPESSNPIEAREAFEMQLLNRKLITFAKSTNATWDYTCRKIARNIGASGEVQINKLATKILVFLRTQKEMNLSDVSTEISGAELKSALLNQSERNKTTTNESREDIITRLLKDRWMSFKELQPHLPNTVDLSFMLESFVRGGLLIKKVESGTTLYTLNPENKSKIL